MPILIMSGLPGEGKSTLARKLEKYINGDRSIMLPCVICSADDWHSRNGEYHFDAANVETAHLVCFKRCVSYAVSWSYKPTKHTIIIDNTNTRDREITPYRMLGLAFGYEVEIVRFPGDLAVSQERNIHAVPAWTLQRMAEQFTQPLPSDWKTITPEEAWAKYGPQRMS